MKRGLWIAIVAVVAILATPHSTYAQIRIIPREAIEEAANPSTIEGEHLIFENGSKLSFGTISEDLPAWKGTLHWSAAEGERLTITRIKTSCGCLVAKWDRRGSIDAGSGTIEVEYLPKGHAGEVMQRIFIYTTLSESTPTAIVQVVGTVTHSADRSGDYPHSAGTLLLRQKEVFVSPEGGSARVAVMNGGSSPLTITHDGRMSVGGVKAYTEPRVLQSGEEGDLVIEWVPDGGPTMLYLGGVNAPPRERKIEIEIENK